MKDKRNILVTVSGGKTSAFMSIFMKEKYKDDNLVFVYANTGREHENTLIFLDKLRKEFNIPVVWIEADVTHEKGIGTNYKIVDFKTASRQGEPFEEVIKKYGIPSKLARHCTRELKEVPIKKFAKDHFKGVYITAIGIRADETHRLTDKKNYIYPLAEIKINKYFVNNWWSQQSFNLDLFELQGNCDFCFLKSINKRIKLLQMGLDVEWWQEMEEKYTSESMPYFDPRNKKKIIDIKKIASDKDRQRSIFDDVEFECFCNK